MGLFLIQYIWLKVIIAVVLVTDVNVMWPQVSAPPNVVVQVPIRQIIDFAANQPNLPAQLKHVFGGGAT